MSSSPFSPRDAADGVTRSLFLKRSAGVAASLSLANILAACGASTHGATTAAGKPPAVPTGTLRFPLADAPTTFDIAYGSFEFDYIVQRSMFDRLVAFNDAYTDLVPSLATSWEQSDDAREFVFHLRPDVRFHDGEPLDSTAVKASLQHFVKAEGSIAQFLSPPRYKLLDDSDPLKLRVVVADPAPDFLRNQTFVGVMSPKALAKGDEYVKTHPVGSGAYKFGGRSGDGRVKVEAFDGYWGDGPYFETIEFSVIRDAGARVNALLAGQADIDCRVPPTQSPRVDTSGRLKSVAGPAWSTVSIFIACNVKPFDDLRVRQAVAYAIDKQALVTAIARGKADVSDVLSPKGVIGYAPPAVTYPHDPDKARELLREAGHESITARALVSPILYLQPELGQAIAGQLKDVGIDLTVDVVDGVALQRYQFDARQQRYAMFPTDLTWLTGAPLNQSVGIVRLFSRYSEPTIDRAVEQMKVTPDGPKRQQTFDAYEGAVSRTVPLVPLFQSVYTDAMAGDVQGYPSIAKIGYGPDLYPMYRAA